MRAQFLERLIKKFPNNYQLGSAVRRYYWLRQENKYAKEEAEEIVLKETFSNN